MEPSEEVGWHLYQVGVICAGWSQIEMELEAIIWWELRIDGWHGRYVTGHLDIERRAKLALDLITLQSFEFEDYEALDTLEGFIRRMNEERNLAVHAGRYWAAEKEGKTHGVVTKGRWRYAPQPLGLDRLNNLVQAIEYTLAFLDKFGRRKNLVNPASQPLALPDTLPALLHPDYQPTDHSLSAPWIPLGPFWD